MARAVPGPCRTSALGWFAPEDARYRERLNAWCAGVGPATLVPARPDADQHDVALDEIAFVSWNVHVGNGDIEAFVADLRSGKLTSGRPVHHFVLMLQEAVRHEGVPAFEHGASGAHRISAPPRSSDIVDASRRLGLSLLYVPSMRNGDSARQPAADRGSAILSTLPLSNPVAVELPGERQRRVAIFARLAIAGRSTTTIDDGRWPIDDGRSFSVGTLHLDALGSPKRLWVLRTPAMRELQVTALSPLLPPDDVVLGADLNTWHGDHESAARRLRELFTTPVSVGSRGARVLDYLFFRVRGEWTARYEVVPSDYGSDHHPLVGLLRRSQARASS
jgi:hypothetical protein